MKRSIDQIFFTIAGITAAVFFLNSLLAAGTKEFHEVLHTVEHSCGIRHTRMPFVNLMVNMAKPFAGAEAASVKDFHFAVFELERKASHCPANLGDMIREQLGPDWERVVRVHSADREDVDIYMETSGQDPRMIIASIDTDDAAVIQLRLRGSSLKQWINYDRSAHKHHKITDSYGFTERPANDKGKD